jgi:hypothetical protein
MSRTQVAAVVSAALIIAVLGLALLLTLLALGVPEMVAGAASVAADGRMSVGAFTEALSQAGQASHNYLSK